MSRTTMCWNCSTPYDATVGHCPICCMANGNVHPTMAIKQEQWLANNRPCGSADVEKQLKHHNGLLMALAEDTARRLERTQRGNTALLEALMGMVNQYFYHVSDGDVLTHSFMGCEEGAIAVLIEAGFAEEVYKGYVLLWDKLNERMKSEL